MKNWARWGIVAIVLAAITVVVLGIGQAGGANGAAVSGGGTTIVTGGTGAPDFTPVITKFAFHFREGEGRFDCLALAPDAASGPGSGRFETNVMYVTGDITTATVSGNKAVFEGTATVTGIGAGTNVPFTASITRGGPGAKLVLEVSGLTFDETLLEGRISF